jgi:hypothetical protein
MLDRACMPHGACLPCCPSILQRLLLPCLLQACLAGPLADLLRSSGQALDPNLVRLAEAWAEAQSNMVAGAGAGAPAPAQGLRPGSAGRALHGGEEGSEEYEGEADGEAAAGERLSDAMLEAEDLLEGLPSPAAAGARAQRPAHELARPTGRAPSGKGGTSSGGAAVGVGGQRDGKHSAPTGRQAGKLVVGQVAAGGAPAQHKLAGGALATGVPAFAPARAFLGQRLGCCFKLGPQGLGYYRDAPPARLNKAALQQLVARPGRFGPVIPIGPQRREGRLPRKGATSRFDSSSSSEEEVEDSACDADEGGADGVKPVTSLGNGRDVGATSGKRARRKPLPGRLRKKLARGQEQHGA